MSKELETARAAVQEAQKKLGELEIREASELRKRMLGSGTRELTLLMESQRLQEELDALSATELPSGDALGQLIELVNHGEFELIQCAEPCCSSAALVNSGTGMWQLLPAFLGWHVSRCTDLCCLGSQHGCPEHPGAHDWHRCNHDF